MAVVIVATVGSATANSFVTLAECQTYADARLNIDLWTTATTDSQNRALVESTREITLKEYKGTRVDTTQVLSWPRNFAEIPAGDAAWSAATYYTTTEIPQRVKDATCELAIEFIKAGTSDIAALDATLNTQQKTVDVLTTVYFAPQMRAKGLSRYPRVMAYIRPLLASDGSTPIIRG